MKKIALSLWTIIAMSSLGFAAGDFVMPEEPEVVVPVVVETEANTRALYVGLGLVDNRTYATDFEIGLHSADNT